MFYAACFRMTGCKDLNRSINEKGEVMKKEEVFSGIVAVVVLCICSALPASAYKLTVKSELSSRDGKVFVQASSVGQWWYANDGNGIEPGGTASKDNTDWKTKGLCWDDIAVKPERQWLGCPAPQLKYKSLALCRDVKVILKRSGCDIDIFVQ